MTALPPPVGQPLRGRVGIVTGAGKGLGRAFALHLGAAGAAIVVNNRNRQVDADGRGSADRVVDEISARGGIAVADTHDVADVNAADAMVGIATERFGRLDFAVTAAGVAQRELFHQSTPERFDEIMAINVAGSARLALACTKVMRAQEFGRIVLVASGAGLHGEPTAAAYSASKGAIIALGRAIAAEGERRNVLTNVLLPYASTQMTEHMSSAWSDVMDPAAVAPVVTSLVDPESQLNGQVIVSAGGGLRLADAVEFATVRIDADPLPPAALARRLDQSRQGPPRSYRAAIDAFTDLATEVTGRHAYGGEPPGEPTNHYGRFVVTAEPAEQARRNRGAVSGCTYPLEP